MDFQKVEEQYVERHRDDRDDGWAGLLFGGFWALCLLAAVAIPVLLALGFVLRP